MQLRLFAQVLSGVALALALVTTTTSNQPSYAEGEKFFCTQEKGVPVTKVRTTRENETFIRWVVKDFKNSMVILGGLFQSPLAQMAKL
jgi:hypothetical protein